MDAEGTHSIHQNTHRLCDLKGKHRNFPLYFLNFRIILVVNTG